MAPRKPNNRSTTAYKSASLQASLQTVNLSLCADMAEIRETNAGPDQVLHKEDDSGKRQWNRKDTLRCSSFQTPYLITFPCGLKFPNTKFT